MKRIFAAAELPVAVLATVVALSVPLMPPRPLEASARGFLARLQEGISHYESRRFFDAAVAFRAALKEAPESETDRVRELLSRSLSAHGVELFNAGESREAEKTFAEALDAFPDFYAHFGLGLLHLSRLEDDDASDHLRRSLQLQPTYARAYKLLALLAYRQGKTEEAQRHIDEAVRLDGTDAESKTLRDRWRNEARYAADFHEVRVEEVTLRLDPAVTRSRGEEVLERAQAVREELAEAFLVEHPRPLVVVLFASETFHRATGSFHWVGGLYDGQLKIPLSESEDPDAADAAIDVALRHELSHVFVRELCALCPNWLNEGIAQYFEDPAGSRGRRADRVRRALRAGAGRRVPFSDVPVRLWAVEDEELARWTYLQGLGFVQFLVDRGHEFRLVLLLEAIRREGSVADAFRAVYGEPLEALEDAWWQEILAGGKDSEGL